MQKLRRREEKARQARQAAIEELQRKREEKRTRDREIAQQEIVRMQNSSLYILQKVIVELP